MAEPFVETETCRTKCRWVAKVFDEFNRPRTTVRSLFYHALRRGVSDYPICGGFVGEIRVTRPFDESDASRLVKWAKLASELGYIPRDAILEEVPGVHVLTPDYRSSDSELWINRSALNPLIWPVCNRYGITLVSVSGARLDDALKDPHIRGRGRETLVLCMTDLSPSGLSFVRALGDVVSASGMRMMHIALTPEQVAKLHIPMVRTDKRDADKRYRELLRSAGLDGGMMAELDALEVCYPGGIAGFLESLIREHVKVRDII